MSDLAVAGRPSNLRLTEGTQTKLVTSDLYDICNRVKEISPRLSILEADNGVSHAFIIMEHCKDGVERRVMRVHELDARVVEKLRYLFAVPLGERFKLIEREEAKIKAAQAEEEFEDLYDRVGRPMWTQLEHDGFIQRSRSYAKTGVAKPGKAR